MLVTQKIQRGGGCFDIWPKKENFSAKMSKFPSFAHLLRNEQIFRDSELKVYYSLNIGENKTFEK